MTKLERKRRKVPSAKTKGKIKSRAVNSQAGAVASWRDIESVINWRVQELGFSSLC